MWISLSLSLLLAACSSGEASETRNRPVVDPTAALTAQVKDAPAPSKAPAQQVSAGAQENPNYLDGIDDQNRGDKVGKVALSGKIQARNGMLYLFETEGRTIAAIDSTQMVAGEFDFGKVEVGRGFYGLGFEPSKKTGDIILNPDEPVVRIEFQNGRLIGGRTDSQENRGWFAYRGAESANKNQIRQLYKQRKGNESAIDAQVKAKK